MFSVLYVDDEPDLLELAKLFLEQSPGFHVDTRTSALVALASPQIGSYDAIISDYQMPEMDGIAFLKAVRSTLGNVPFILFTGRGREEIVIEAINNGVDFYLQKGGDVRSQFAELTHKVRQAVAQRRTEHSLIESEKRLVDIINFLPDATLAIDKFGTVIAWNRAIEAMTGIPAIQMIGRGDYEYALPFYGERRPILIDLVLLPDEELTRRYYSVVKKEGAILVAETTLPHPQGQPKTLFGTASILYDKEGNVAGAIESIRDITSRKTAEDELRAAYEQITASEEELREQVDVLEDRERRIRESESRLRYMLGFYEKAKAPQQDLLGYAVEGAGAVTGSPLGYLAFLNDDESELTMYAWSRSAMKECSLREKPIVYKTAKTGLWGEAVRQRRPVTTNDYAAPDPAKKGYPKGHPAIIRHMNVPVMDDGHIVLVAGVANKPGDYTDEDVLQLSLLMQSLWLVIKRRRTEEALLESERKYRDLFENSILGIFRTTPEGTFSTLNNSFARIAGYETPADMLAAIRDVRAQLYVHDTDRDRFLSALATNGYVKEFEAQFRHRDGHPVWISINATAVRDADGSIQYFEGTIEDITHQKNAEQALRKEKIFSDAVVDSVPGLLYLYDSNGRLVRWNKAHETMTGYSAEELAGFSVLDWFPGERDREVIRREIERALTGGNASAEADLQTQSGQKIPFLFTARRLEIDGNVYFTGVGIDITERQRVQDELRAAYEQLTASDEELQGQYQELTKSEQRIRESESKFRGIFEKSSDALMLYADNHFLDCNPRTLSLFGFGSPEEFAALDAADVSPEYQPDGQDSRSASAAHIRHALETGEDHFEWVHRKKDGTTFPAEVILSLLELDQKTVLQASIRDISERKAAEAAIRVSAEQFRNIIDFSPFGMHFYERMGDDTLVFTGANPAADSILGVDNSRFIGKSIEEAFPGLTGTEIPGQYRKVARDGGTWHTDQVIYDEASIRGAYSVTAFQIRPDAMVAMFFDITERKKAELALHEKTEELERYFTTSLDLFCIADMNGNFVRLNPEWEKTLGYSLADLEGHRFLDFVHPDDLPATLDAVSRLGDKQDVLNFTNRYRHRDGTYRWIEWRSRPAGNLIIAAARDITSRKEMEEALRESSEKYRTIFETIQDVYYRADPAGNMILASPSILPLFGYDSMDEIIGKNLACDLWMYPQQRQKFLDEIKKNGAVKNYEVIIRRKDGKSLTIATSSHFSHDAEGNITGVEGILHDITALREADQQVRLLAGITEITPASIIVHDAGGHFLYANQRTFDLHGWTRDEFMALNLHNLDVPVSEELINERIDLLRKNGEASFDVEHFKKDGSRFPLHVTIKSIRWDNQDAILSIAMDITAKKRSEESLRESEEKVRLIADNAQDMIFRMSLPDGRYEYISPAVVRLTGYAQGEFYADPGLLLHLIHPDWQDYFKIQWGTMLEGNAPPTYEYEIIDRSGKTHWFNQRNVLLKNADGKPLALEGIVTDISERKMAEAALRESEARYRAVIEHIQDAFIRVDTGGNLIMASPSAARMFGYDSAENLLGTSIKRFYYQPEARQKMLDQIAKDTQIVDYEMEFVRKDGCVFWGSVNAHFIINREGTVIGTEAVIHDIDERRSMEHAIREANRKLGLLSNITRHDLANQLTALQGFIQIATLKKTDPVIADYLAKIGTVAATMNRQIEFTRTYQELGIKEPAWFPVHDLIAKAESQVPVKFSGTCRGVEIFADSMLERVFFNIFDNAARHGTHVTEITVRCERDPDGFVVLVEDNGAGVPLAEKEQIFARGYGKHTGLGLFLAREILAITGITIKETGIPGHGARFEMLVPKGSYRFEKSRGK